MFKKFNLALAILIALGTSPSVADPFGSAPIGYSGSAPSTGGGGGGGTPGGNSGEVQYNAAGSFAGITGATTDGNILTLTAPVLGTPTSGTLTNATGLPISTGVSGLAANIATFLGTPTSANLAAAVTNETGSGLLVFGTSPALITPVLGVATGTSIALGGATLGTNAFAVTGTAAISGALTSAAFTSSGTILAGASSNIGFTGRSLISSAADGNVALTNNAASSFGLLQLGGTTSSFPALKRSTTSVQIRLADDSAFSTISTGGSLLNGSSSGVISILPQAAAGTYNFNLPTTAGSAGQLLASGGGIGAPMTWVAAGAGTVTQLNAGQGITTGGSPITSTGTVATTEVLGNGGAVISGTTYTVNTTTDAATQLVFTGSSPSAFTLGSPVSGVGFDVVNQGSATVTITATGNINGSATLAITAGTWAHVFANSTSTWYAEVPGGGGGSGFPITIGSTSIASGSTTTSISGLTLVAPALGTPTAIVLTSGTGLPVSTGISGLGTGVATFLATPSSANLATALTDETGSGAAVFATSPTLVTPALGTPSALVLTNATGTPTSIGLANGTGLPVATGISGLGTGVATALGVNVSGTGAICLASGSACATSGITVGSTTISSGVTGTVSYNNAGVYGEITPLTWNGSQLGFSQSGASSAPAFVLTGVPFTGTGTTAIPMVLMGNGTAATTWSTSGTYLGVNAVTGFGGRYIDFRANGGSTRLFDVDSSGNITNAASITMGATSQFVFSSRTKMTSSSNGVLNFNFNNNTTFASLSSADGLSLIGTAPTPTGTGTPTMATGSTDMAGEVTAGTLGTSVIITFAAAKTNAPFCVVTSQTQLASFVYTISTTAITITQTATSGNKIDYHCTPH